MDVNFALSFTGTAVEYSSYSDRAIDILIPMTKGAHLFTDPFKLKQECQNHYRSLLFVLVFHKLWVAIISTALSTIGFRHVCSCENSSKVKSLFISGKRPLAKSCLILPASTPSLQAQKSGFPGNSDISRHYKNTKWSVVTDLISNYAGKMRCILYWRKDRTLCIRIFMVN